jgi:hypothetical protein
VAPGESIVYTMSDPPGITDVTPSVFVVDRSADCACSPVSVATIPTTIGHRRRAPAIEQARARARWNPRRDRASATLTGPATEDR